MHLNDLSYPLTSPLTSPAGQSFPLFCKISQHHTFKNTFISIRQESVGFGLRAANIDKISANSIFQLLSQTSRTAAGRREVSLDKSHANPA